MAKPPEGMKLIDDNGLRIDGRKPHEMRPIHMEAGVLKRAQGSCALTWGGNKIVAGVYGPREAHPRKEQDPRQAIIRCRYNMAAFSVSDRKRPGPDRRSQEITKVLSEALATVILREPYPRSAVDIFIEVLEAEAGSRVAGLTAASVALADAGIPMKGLVSAVAAGLVDDTVVLDLSREEDNYGTTDMPVAIVPNTGEIVLMQMDGSFSDEQFDQALTYALDACHKVHDLQKRALLQRYATNGGDA